MQKNPGGETVCPLDNVRVIKQKNRQYLVSFEIPFNVSYGRIVISTIGENGKANDLRITDTSAVSGCDRTFLDGETLMFSNMKADTKVRVNITLAEQRDYAMEVNVYEHN